MKKVAYSSQKNKCETKEKTIRKNSSVETKSRHFQNGYFPISEEELLLAFIDPGEGHVEYILDNINKIHPNIKFTLEIAKKQ